MKNCVKKPIREIILGLGLSALILSCGAQSESSDKNTDGISSIVSKDVNKERRAEEKWMESFLFVRDQVRFEPHEDVLKSSQGVLWSRKGNAKEQAVLLTEMLREEGENVRYVFGTLEESEARRLAESMFPEKRDFSYSKDVPLSFPSQNSELIERIKKHCWVQVEKNEGWMDLDPCFPDAEVGQAFASRENVEEYLDEDFFPQVGISLEVEKGKFDKKRVLDPETESVLEWEGTLQEISEQPLYLKILAHIEAEEKEKGSSPMGGLMAGLAGRKSTDESESKKKAVQYLASLQILDEELDSGSFSQVIYGQESEESKDAETITKVILKFKWEAPEKKPIEWERLLFEKHSDEHQPHYFQRHSILIAGSEIPREAWEGNLTDILDNKDLNALKNDLEAIRNQLKDQKDLKAIFEKTSSLENELGPEAGHLINMIFVSTSDQICRDLAQSLSVFGYYSLPRIIINSFEGIGDRLLVFLDLRQNSMEAVPYPGQAMKMSETFLYGRGVIESILEGEVIELLTGKQPLTTARLMQIAGSQDIPIRLFSHLERDDLESLGLPPLAAEKAKNVLDSRHILIIPEWSVTIDGKERWGWWDLDPQKGEVVGVLESGLYQAVLERTIMDTTGMLHDDMGLVVGAMVGCVDTHWVLFTLILKYGELNKAALQEAKDYMKNIGSYLCPGFEKTAEIGVGASVELEDCWKEEIGIGFSAGLKIDQGWCKQFAKGFQCASTTILNFYLMHTE